MHKAFIYFLFIKIVFFSSTVNGQEFTDSLQNKSLDELQNLFLKNRKSDSITAKKVLLLYSNKARQNKDTVSIIKGLRMKYLIVNEYTKQLYLDTLITITKNRQNQNYPAIAYYEKSQFFLHEQRNIKEALNNLYLARKYSRLNSNINLLYRIEYSIGIIKSEHLNEKEEALKIFKECEKFYSQEIIDNHKYRYLYTLHVMAETYIGLKKYDSASYYNTIGHHKATNTNDAASNKMKAYFVLCEGINQYTKTKYTATIDSINIALPTMIEIEDKSNIIDSYFYLGKSYYALDYKEKAIRYFKKTDSILETLKSIPQYKHIKTYEYLKNYYKGIGDLEKQNIYLDKLNSVLDDYLNDQMFISKKIKEDYDIPLLLEEKETIIEKLNKNNSTYVIGIIVLGFLLTISGGLIYYQYRKKQRYRIRFETLILDRKLPSESKTPIKNKNLKVPEKHVTYILEKLVTFENERGYLTLGLSAQSLADGMETNVKYLSLVINHYKDKSFSSYLNELRINYAVKELQENTTLRKFTIKAIANEFGYSTAETFSNAFYKQVKIKPSYYIKELNKK